MTTPSLASAQTTNAAPDKTNSAPKAATCALVYSDVRHVPNINQILEDIEEVLSEQGFSALRLGDETRTGQGYPESLRRLFSDCVLGVVVLDGLRPNVTYELGFLFGMNKPMIVLQSVAAFISVKTFFSDSAGLQKKQFDLLRNPVLRQDHFSDFDRTHVGFFDCAARKGEDKHLKTLLGRELAKSSDAVVAETARTQTRGSPQGAVDALSAPIAALARLYYAKAEDVEIPALREAYDAVTAAAKAHGIHVPPGAAIMAAAAWIEKAAATVGKPDDRKACLHAALDLYQQALAYLDKDYDPERWADVHVGIGYAHNGLSLWEDRAEHNRKAVSAYEQALKVYTLDRFPIQYAKTQNSLGSVFSMLAEVKDKAQNCKRAIAALEQALGVRTLDRFPTDFAATQNNLGNAFRTLAEVEDKVQNCRKATAAFEQALKVYTLDRFSMDFAMAWNNLGNAFNTLADVDDKTQNCKKAIAAFEQALKVYTFERVPIQYALTQNNLGNAFRKLAEVEDAGRNCRKAVAAYEQALRVRTLDRFPIQHAATLNNLGNAFNTLAEVEDKVQNCRKAIEAFEQALKVYTLDRFPIQYAGTQNNLGNVFSTLAEVEDKVQNCRKATAAFEESARVFKGQNCPGPLSMVERNLARIRTLSRVKASPSRARSRQPRSGRPRK